MREKARKQANNKQLKNGPTQTIPVNEQNFPGDKKCNRQSDPCNFLNKKIKSFSLVSHESHCKVRVVIPGN